MSKPRAWVFEVPGEPGFKRRARAVRTARGLRVANPPENESDEAKVAYFARRAGVKPLDGPVRLTVCAWYALPKSRHRKRKPVATGTPKTSKPDSTNVLKMVEDALNGVAWIDDAQVFEASITRMFGAQGDPGFLVVSIEEYVSPCAPAYAEFIGRQAMQALRKEPR